jgi:hypothetical protein
MGHDLGGTGRGLPAGPFPSVYLAEAPPHSLRNGKEKGASLLFDEHLARGAWEKFRKQAKYQSHQRSRSVPYDVA